MSCLKDVSLGTFLYNWKKNNRCCIANTEKHVWGHNKRWKSNFALFSRFCIIFQTEPLSNTLLLLCDWKKNYNTLKTIIFFFRFWYNKILLFLQSYKHCFFCPQFCFNHFYEDLSSVFSFLIIIFCFNFFLFYLTFFLCMKISLYDVRMYKVTVWCGNTLFMYIHPQYTTAYEQIPYQGKKSRG